MLVSGGPLQAKDWPEWRGSGRLGVWEDTGIVDRLPEALAVTWRVPIRSGFAGPAVADGRVFVTDWQEDPTSRTLEGTERLLAIDETTGEVLWTHEWSTSYRMLMTSYAIGPRATPTVDDDRVYVVGATGRLLCLDVATGAVRWETDYAADYDTSIPVWGVSSAPIVDGERVIAIVGGQPDAMVVAFDKRTGDEVWRALEATGEMGYSQPVIYEAGGAQQLIIWHATALASLDPETGAVYWEEPIEVGAGMAIATPVQSGPYLLVSQLYYGSTMMRLSDDRPAATKLWQGRSRSPDEPDGLHSTIGTPVVVGDYVYGLCVDGELRALDARTGERRWMSLAMNQEAREQWGAVRWGTAYMVRHADRHFVSTDDGYLVLAQFTPEGYEELGRTRLIEPTFNNGFGPRNDWNRPVVWAHPAFANRHVVQRNDREIVRASLAAEDYPSAR